MIAFQDGFDIQACSATENGCFVATPHNFVSSMKIMLIIKKGIFFAGISYINQVIRYLIPGNPVVGEVFARTDVHSAIDLARIGADNFSIDVGCQLRRKLGFAAGSRPQNGN